MSSQQIRQFQMLGGGGGRPGEYNDTTFTKIFVGGLAWETQNDAMRRYFEQFGEILEAVVITDKNTGRSKGYGFVTFKDPEAAMRACQNPSPVIDGRRANCNLASLGANKTRPPAPHQGPGRFRATPGLMAPPTYHGLSSQYIHQPSGQYSLPFSAYGYTGYSQDNMLPLNYYNVYGGQQFSPYYGSPGGSSSGAPPGMFQNVYHPFYAHHQYGQNSNTQAQGFGLHHQYPQILQYTPYFPQQVGTSTGILSLPSSTAMTTSSTTTVPITMVTATTTTTTPTANADGVTSGTGASQASVTTPEQKTST